MPKPLTRKKKLPERCFGRCQFQVGYRGKCRTKCFGLRASMGVVRRGKARSTFFGTFLGTPFGASTFRSTFSALFFSGRGLGTSLDGRQDCKTCLPGHLQHCTTPRTCHEKSLAIQEGNLPVLLFGGGLFLTFPCFAPSLPRESLVSFGRNSPYRQGPILLGVR